MDSIIQDKTNRFHHTLRSNLIKDILIWSGVFFSTLGIVFTLTLNNLVDYMLSQMAIDRMSYQTVEIAKHMTHGDQLAIDEEADALTQDESISGMIIIDSTGLIAHISLHEDEAPSLKISPGMNSIEMRKIVAGKEYLRLYEAEIPGHPATLFIIMDSRPELKAIYASSTWAAFLLLIFIGISVLVLHFSLHRHLIKPIDEIKHLIDGDLALEEKDTLINHLPDEVAFLARSYEKTYEAHNLMEHQFLQAQKMEAMGTLVGGIAHDFNNMLAGIMGNTYLAKSRAKDDEKLLRKLETIDKLSLRATDMIKQMLTFARKDRLEMRIFSLTGFVKEAMKLAAAAIPENIEHSCNYPSEELFVHGDATQLQQVLMNLINNARDSLEGVRNGKIACSLRPFTADAAFRQRHPACPGDSFACLTVQDNGEGIPEELLSRIFDPFFTTKEVDKGTGLGLAMVYGSIESHKGAIEVDSAAGQGTTFNIYLPLVRQAAEEKQVPLQDVKTGNKELILIADDEETVRQMYEEVLGALEYRVITACDGGEAVSLFEQNRDEIALVILDVVMPVMGGVDAAKTIRQLQPQVPIVFATGYDIKTALKGEDGIADYPVLNKPFSVEYLSSTIRRLLD